MSETPQRSTPEEEKPPLRHIERAIEMANCSPCRSKRGVRIFRGKTPISSGYNFKPSGFNCDGSEVCKATCRQDAIHAEQMALIGAGGMSRGADLLHVKTVKGALVPSGGPSCVECSKLILASGIDGVWLFHESGWKRYTATDFHAQSLAAQIPHATHEALVAALERYGRHDIDCELYVCKVCRRRADDEQHYIGTVDSHVFQGPNACDCGFSKALNESR